MVIAGEADQVMRLSAARKLASVIPNAELKIIPAAEHTALLENPTMYSSLVRGFPCRKSARPVLNESKIYLL
jgi:pimeloyl-ACP methyl ester carboxylesterase